MAITVGDIYAAFPNFKPEDMIKLCNGNENLNGRTQVSLANIAAFGDENLSIFAAKMEGKNYTNLLGEKARADVNAAIGINASEQRPQNEIAQNNTKSIPMDTSVFDLAQNTKENIA